MKLPRLWPFSLAKLTVLLVVIVVAVAEITTFSVVFHDGRESHLRQTGQHIAGQIRLLQTILPGLDERARRKLEQTDPGGPWLQLRPDGRDVPERTPNFGFAGRLGIELGRSLGEPVVLRNEGQGRRSSLWIGFDVTGERWWLVLPPPRFEPRGMPLEQWFWLGGALLALIVVAGVFVRGIVRPLRRLGEAVVATGDGRARPVLPEGPMEVRQLAEQHNRMVSQLAQADAERREMLAGLTHDLRAPLARLRVRLALLENDAERAGLERDGEDMERIVGQCLSFLRSEADEASPVAPLCLADAVSDEVARQRELGRPVDMTVVPAAVACHVAVAHGDLQRVLDNLIGNALQYGAPPVEIAVSAPEPASVLLTVRDHGPGIPPAQRARVFEAFVQGEPARATRGSCGLGLAIVRRIVVRCGGSVRLSEADGGGLAVEMSLPCVAMPASPGVVADSA
ncbi:ATP-binding protein [Propionivibrio dicarboxylicus]|uniref:histidine kinase n=1 Tax=Propionivibrio dicarboxylicus TaxID=83767 RepID=A0A1G7VQ08_9RHOO|nr:ATP-binding protein [Propionivibrio dicarboxylicus]SDG61638.1 two-component system, OmpR family, osmolarity sensor histidine kinase EnvZ [Propionivibrio dicarboxylicus]